MSVKRYSCSFVARRCSESEQSITGRVLLVLIHGLTYVRQTVRQCCHVLLREDDRSQPGPTKV